MGKFRLEIITPERDFFEGEVESLVFSLPDGEYCVLAGHEPFFAKIEVGVLKIDDGSEVRHASCSGAFAEVERERVRVFAQTCEWPEEIDLASAERSAAYERDKLLHEQALAEHKVSEANLARALTRIKVKKSFLK